METTLFLVRHGETAWTTSRRVMGRRDVGLSDAGRTQAEQVARHLYKVEVAEVLSSPLLRAFETAERVAAAHGIDVARDPRLVDVAPGRWEGMAWDEVAASPEYRAFVRNPDATGFPDGEGLDVVRDRALASIEQALEDNELGANIVVVTHAGVIRVLLAHWLGMRLASYHRLRVGSGSVSVLRWGSDRERPRVLAVNHGDSLESVLA